MAGGGGEEVPFEILTDFSTLLGRTDIVKLAAKLGCSEQLVMKWTNSGQMDDAIAMQLFTDWKGRKPPSQRSDLGSALVDIGRRDLHDILEEKCRKLKEKNPKPTEPTEPTPKAAEGTASPTTRKLKPGTDAKLFRNISRKFPNIEDAYDLADGLLAGIEDISGREWAMTRARGGTDPTVVARSVLDHWSNKSPAPYGRKLFDELNEILPRIADQFKAELLS